MSGQLPFVKFSEDPINSCVLQTISKKPVNSDHFSLVKRIKLSDYLKPTQKFDNLRFVGQRAKEYMTSVGFAYGRLIEKNWADENKKYPQSRIQAPGPTIKSVIEEDPDSAKEEPSSSKVLNKFLTFKPAEIEKKITKKTSNTQPDIVGVRMSASQKQAREYLNYLMPLSPKEQELIRTAVFQKKQEIENLAEQRLKAYEKQCNIKGIFNESVNKERCNSLLPVKILTDNKILVEPLVRSAIDTVNKRRIKSWKEEPYVEHSIHGGSRKEKKGNHVIDMLQHTITKKTQKKKDNEWKKKLKMNWVDRLNQSMDESIEKCRPPELSFIF